MTENTNEDGQVLCAGQMRRVAALENAMMVLRTGVGTVSAGKPLTAASQGRVATDELKDVAEWILEGCADDAALLYAQYRRWDDDQKEQGTDELDAPMPYFGPTIVTPTGPQTVNEGDDDK